MPSTPPYRICVIYTGGTLVMERGPDGLLRPPADPNKVIAAIAAEADLDAELHFEVISNIDSVNTRIHNWRVMVSKINEFKDQYDAFVVLNGTDALEYADAVIALAFPNKRIGVTGAQLDPDDPNSDAPGNIKDTLVVVCDPRLNEPVTVFDHQIIRASRALKIDPKRLDAFQSPGIAALGRVDGKTVTWREGLSSERKIVKAQPLQQWAEGVVELIASPLLTPEVINALVQPDAISGLLIHAYESGAMASDLGPAIENAVAKGKPICLLSRDPGFDVRSSGYESGRDLEAHGLIALPNMTPGMALVKMSASIEETNVRASQLSGRQRIAAIRRELMLERALEFALDSQRTASQLSILQ